MNVDSNRATDWLSLDTDDLDCVVEFVKSKLIVPQSYGIVVIDFSI
jgi:hypothetical protein